jgi:predicted DCC family thiol-disulfide oxidoreductase YuxK
VSTKVVLYDEHCGFCRWTSERLLRWDRRGRLRFVAIGSSEGRKVLSGMDDAARDASMHASDGKGVVSGGDAIPMILEELPGGRPLAKLAAASPRLTGAAYRMVARHRRRLARVVGERACEVDPSRRR